MTNPGLNQIYKIYSGSYVAAIIQGSFMLGQYLISVPEELLMRLRVESMTGQFKYPFLLLEAESPVGGRLFLHSDDEGLGQLKSFMDNTGYKVLAVYNIKNNYYGNPKNPGTDYMGILDHEHLNEE